MASKKQNKGLAVFQRFMTKMKRNGLTYKQAKAAWRRVAAAELKKTHAKKKRKGGNVQFGPMLHPAHARRLKEAKRVAQWEAMQKRVARRGKAAERLARIKGNKAKREAAEAAAAARAAERAALEARMEKIGLVMGDPGRKKKGKKGSKKKTAAAKKRKVSAWNRFVAKHRRAGLSMKAIARLWRKSGKAAAKPKAKKKSAKRDPGWWKHPRLHGKAARKGWLRHKRAGRDPEPKNYYRATRGAPSEYDVHRREYEVYVALQKRQGRKPMYFADWRERQYGF